jgi:hypothetical protein
MKTTTNKPSPSDLSSARAVIGLSVERAHDWCVARRPTGYVDAWALAAQLAEIQGGKWWDVLDVFEARTRAAIAASKV